MGLNETGCLYIDCISNDSIGCISDGDWSDEDYLTEEALDITIGEIRNQYDAALSAIHSNSQKSGILLAFTSIMFIELFRLNDGSMVWSLLLLVMLASFMVGTYNVINIRGFPLGIELSKIINYISYKKLYNLRIHILNGKSSALYELIRISHLASVSMMIQSMLLLVCIILFIYMEMSLNVMV